MLNPSSNSPSGGATSGAKTDFVSSLLEKTGLDSAVMDLIAPADMGKVPYSLVVPSRSGTVIVNGKKELGESEQIRASLGELCGKLGVDAVVVAQVQLAYKKGFITETKGGGFMGLFGTSRETRKTIVEVDVAVIDASGHLIMSTKKWLETI